LKIQDAQYLTEVHHVDGSGADSGVVYSEMQDLENDMEIIVDRKRKQLFYPPGSSYAVSTGSRLEELRTQCSASVLGNFTGASTISIWFIFRIFNRFKFLFLVYYRLWLH